MAKTNGHTAVQDDGEAASSARRVEKPCASKAKHFEPTNSVGGALALSEHMFEGHVVRTVARGEEQWFVASDVCRALSLQSDKGSFGRHLAKLDPDEKVQVGQSGWAGETPTLGLNPGLVAETDQASTTPGCPPARSKLGLEVGPDAWIVSESGLYILILRSRDATTPGTFPYRFRRWLTHEVLPAIRKTGHYGSPRITYGSFEPDNTPPGRYVSLVGRDGEWHHYYSPYATVRNDMDAEDARTLAHGIKIIEGFWRKLQPLHGDQPELLQSYAWHALGRAVRSAAEDADQLIAMHESRRLRQPDH